MSNVINCREIAESIMTEARHHVHEIIEQTGEAPRLAVIVVGDDHASQVYVRNKIRRCESVGIEYKTYHFSEQILTGVLKDRIKQLNNDDNVHGILVQLPLPSHIDVDEVIECINPQKDVDGLHPVNQARLLNNVEPRLDPCTPAGVMKILEAGLPDGLSGLSVAVLGRSRLFGQPMAQMLVNADATVSICHSKTGPVSRDCIMMASDIVISAIGKPEYFNHDHFLDGTTIIDVGINRDQDGLICGDVDTHSVLDNLPLARITSVPGGVGVITTAMLILNVVKAYRIQKGCER